MKFLNLRLSLLAFGTVAAMVSTSAHAVWVFGNSTITGQTSATYSATAPSTNGDPSVTLTGFSATNTVNSSGTITGVTGNWTQQKLSSWSGSGLGVVTGSESSPDHAVDNSGSTEAVLLSFGTSNVALTSIGLGWISNGNYNTSGQLLSSSCSGTSGTNYSNCLNGGAVVNSTIKADISLFRWVGAQGQTPPNLTSTSASSLTSSGWQLVSSYDMGVDQTAAYSNVNASGLTSSWWLISAYNSGLTGGATVGTNIDNGKDYFKLYAVAGNVVSGNTGGKLPEPATLALTSVALLGVAGLRRRSKAKLAA